MAGLLSDLTLEDFETREITDIVQRTSGGLKMLYILDYASIDHATTVVDATGQITTLGLVADAPVIRVQPTQDENTTGSVTSERASARSAMKYNQSFAIEVAATGLDSYIFENIMLNSTNLVLIEAVPGCEVLIHGLDASLCGETTTLTVQLQGLRMSVSDLQINTVTGDRTKVLTFAGVSSMPPIPFVITLAALDALATN